jgi:hypothetical protein
LLCGQSLVAFGVDGAQVFFRVRSAFGLWQDVIDLCSCEDSPEALALRALAQPTITGEND